MIIWFMYHVGDKEIKTTVNFEKECKKEFYEDVNEKLKVS